MATAKLIKYASKAAPYIGELNVGDRVGDGLSNYMDKHFDKMSPEHKDNYFKSVNMAEKMMDITSPGASMIMKNKTLRGVASVAANFIPTVGPLVSIGLSEGGGMYDKVKSKYKELEERHELEKMMDRPYEE